MSKINTTDLLRVCLRLTVLQSTWCERGMQSVGLCYCLVPGLRRLTASEDALRAAIRPYREPINTHPFLAGVLVGTALRLEEDERDSTEVAGFVRTAAGPLAAVGDPFFCGALPALTAVCAAIAALLVGPLAGIITLLVLFNTVHFAVRFSGVFIGYTEGMNVLGRVARWLSPGRTAGIKVAASFIAGAVVAAIVSRFTGQASLVSSSLLAVFALGLTVAMVRWRKIVVLVFPIAIIFTILIEVLV